MVRIGITERGDAGIDLSWNWKLDTVDGAIIITKNLTMECIRAILNRTKPLIVHCTCTGWGGTGKDNATLDCKCWNCNGLGRIKKKNSEEK